MYYIIYRDSSEEDVNCIEFKGTLVEAKDFIDKEAERTDLCMRVEDERGNLCLGSYVL